mmetsp:Transcript_120691/g.375776  ORF Transcript_120691/g.375776 Transcript_120691/m.375776 type:complete len:369 (-) Transcript_120691:64-1170(-)|eukprot:CAMPEP_0204596742 /NCGR_PEP_ID=MMETSP0661-20131031/53413_1 /ASSEMBLY_ACC=CAM_ASM_000606 /TAXON_ID=109239 /ORGANISM="Alexandrium margalefi, Strain AMGDE01CS-322" /LENGTH=368 /DNA_ID=CAMNT_0051607375 /DNA_START=21 /DNA_END=1127 /DNA_ORIENTATION=-
MAAAAAAMAMDARWLLGPSAAMASPEALAQEAAVAHALQPQEEDASLWGGFVRMFTSMTRPLSYLVAKAAFPLKQVLAAVTHKAAFALKKTMANPTKLFRRQAFSPLDGFRGHDTLAMGLRHVFARGGMRAIARKAFAPYMANAVVAMSMFHTYTVTRHCLFEGGLRDEPAAAGLASLAAGAVQATLSAPLYNLRLGRLGMRKSTNLPKAGLFAGLRELGQRQGLAGLFRNYPYILAQECCSLGAFFVSFEWVKIHATAAVRTHVDPSGKKDMYAWASAACVAGMALSAVGTPFENVHEWHATRSGGAVPPGSVLRHFYRDARPKCRKRILLSGLKMKLPLAPVAGLPLLAYEVMMHNGLAPVLHQDL